MKVAPRAGHPTSDLDRSSRPTAGGGRGPNFFKDEPGVHQRESHPPLRSSDRLDSSFATAMNEDAPLGLELAVDHSRASPADERCSSVWCALYPESLL